MVKLVVIADDFTGALDTGVQFAKNSINTLIVLYDNFDFSKLDECTEVLVIDTESRHITQEEAAIRVKEIGKKGFQFGVPYFYKKTDSALRGNIGSELGALMEGTNMHELMFIPAYPDARRTTLNGIQYVDKMPLEQTSFAKDPINPVTCSYIPSLIQEQFRTDVKVVRKDNLCSTLNRGGDNRIYVFDAESNKDLSKIASFLKARRRLKLTAGCAGFANTLLGVLDLKLTTENEKARQEFDNMLVVCGSINELSLQQVRYAEENGFYSVALNPRQKLEHDYFQSEKGKEMIDRLVSMLDENKNVIIKVIDNPEDEEVCNEYAQTVQIEKALIPSLVTRNIARLITEISKKQLIKTLVIFGGDTSVEIVKALKLNRVIPKEEIMTGVVLSEAERNGENFNLVTKSGGLGEIDVLTQIREYNFT